MTESVPGNGPGSSGGNGLSCVEFLELTTEYLEEALSSPHVARFEAHLALCEGCTTILNQLRTQISLAGGLREEDIDPSELSRLLDAFADWTRDTPTDH